MAVRQFALSPWEIVTLMAAKTNLIAGHVSNAPAIDLIRIDEIGAELHRIEELRLLLKETLANLPAPHAESQDEAHA